MGILDSVLKVFVGDKSKKDVKAIQPIVDKIKKAEASLTSITNDELRAKTATFKKIITDAKADIVAQIDELKVKADTTADIDVREDIYTEIDSLETKALEITDKTLNEILPDAFAVVKETARRFTENESIAVTASAYDRELSATKEYVTLTDTTANWATNWNAAGTEVTWNMIHYDVQLIGGVALHNGNIAEMQTGEGKTLVATLPVYLNALTGNGVHLVTVNDYLARRDSEWMAPLFQFHGLTIDCIDNHRPNSEARRNAYNSDIVYGTNNEFGFDYLRDNMSHAPEDLVQRKHNYAIVDEVDSVLIDDARTPLIISGPVPKGDVHEYEMLKPRIANVVNIQQKFLTGVLAEAKKLIKEGNTKDGGFKLLQAYRGIPKNKALIKYLSEEGVKQLLQKTENQYMQDNNRDMHLIDADLYYVIEEKNNQIDLTDKGVTHISKEEDANFFILPEIAVEISKIEELGLNAEEEAAKKEELFRDYSVKSERIHTITQLLKAYSLFEKDVEYVVMDNKVKIVDEQTGRIMDGRRFSDGLHQALEAKENVKIEDATQTLATVTLQNYFRMYHKLSGMTGTAVTEAGEFWEIYKLDVIEIPTNRPIARDDKQDLIYKTKREKYNAVIEDVVKIAQAGRPVLIGTTSVEISELLSRMLTMSKVQHNVLNAKLHQKEADIVAEAGKAGIVTIATNMAGRGTDIKLSKEVLAAGGLAIIGTERHDSRRVDRQLRGRAGRQGDVGSSQFYVSLEDNLMRLFGSERIAKLMDKMNIEEGEVLQAKMLSNSIERAQKKVEENNFGTRKHLLEYDDVMNAQREVVYKRRRHALYGERLKVDIANMLYELSETVAQGNSMSQDFKNFEFELIRYFAMPSPVTEQEFVSLNAEKLTGKVYQAALKHYESKMEHTSSEVYRVIKQIYEDPNNQFERIGVPFSDGKKSLNVGTNLQKAYDSEGKQIIADFEKNITLALIDDAWKTHLRKMDELKQSVRLAVHEQKDPLLIYKFEAFELFKGMLQGLNKDVISFLFKAELPSANPDQVQAAEQRQQQEMHTEKEEIQNLEERTNQNRAIANARHQQQQATPVETVVREEPKIGRNDKIMIKNPMTGETKTLKFKQAIPLLEKGWTVVQKA
ncbi:preprotein translocase subunit SecA [Aquimarina agarivorans]|uniref:preprotein translocase subunit SecA n=1 Tax=Aquimarina agarivorans TaxID=980584 RepID=UPI000248FD02|nr:preprotein translocase subunit SecA [Aquimarina agarivorans]